MDDGLRTRLWNAIFTIWLRDPESEFWAFVEPLCSNFLKLPLNKIRNLSRGQVTSKIHDWFGEVRWFDVYNMIEFIASEPYFHRPTQRHFIYACDVVLKEELSAYRFVDDRLAELTSETEIATVEEVIQGGIADQRLAGVAQHLQKAVQAFGKRPRGDYVNAIKESILAVEAAARVALADPSATLGAALKELDKRGVKLHPSLRLGFDKIYGYTSDAAGIRHALTEEPIDDSYDEAKFMLPACAAFSSYLIEKAKKAGLL